MKVAVFSTQPHDRRYLDAANRDGFELRYFEPRLSEATVRLAEGFDAVCVFVHDELAAPVCRTLAHMGVRWVVLRCAGFNNVDVLAAHEAGLVVARVPAYSPHAVAEHTVGLILTLSRKFHRAWARVREQNFRLDGLLGFELHGRVVGIVGTGRIGTVVAQILAGFGCRLLACDPYPNDTCRTLGVEYVELPALLEQSEIITLHCPLTPQSHHLIDAQAFERMRDGVVLINTSRGGLIDTRAAITALKRGKLGALGLDVYEEEADLFYSDLSDRVIQDDVFARLLTFPNVLITAHQAFFTHEALTHIAETTIANLSALARGEPIAANLVTPRLVRA